MGIISHLTTPTHSSAHDADAGAIMIATSRTTTLIVIFITFFTTTNALNGGGGGGGGGSGAGGWAGAYTRSLFSST
jgi:hypothetical protein